jgi:hypothetical protein
MVCLVQTVHLSYVKISTISKRIEMSFLLGLITSKYYQVHLKWFCEPMVCSTQTVHESCDKISTISKWTETSFHLSVII